MNTTAPGVPLGTPIQDGVRWTNFFNGRLLTGDDLSGDQDAGRAARLQLGVAGGAGVAWGLSVRPGPSSSTAQPTLQITAGLAVNSLGKPLALAADVEVSLLAPATPTPPSPPDVGFTTCAPPALPPTYLTGSGVYVLVIGPAERGEGSATVNGQIQAAPARTVGYYADTVQFRVAAAPIPATDAALADPNKARNRVACRFLGTTDVRRAAFEADPLGGGPAACRMLNGIHSRD